MFLLWCLFWAIYKRKSRRGQCPIVDVRLACIVFLYKKDKEVKGKEVFDMG